MEDSGSDNYQDAFTYNILVVSIEHIIPKPIVLRNGQVQEPENSNWLMSVFVPVRSNRHNVMQVVPQNAILLMSDPSFNSGRSTSSRSQHGGISSVNSFHWSINYFEDSSISPG